MPFALETYAYQRRASRFTSTDILHLTATTEQRDLDVGSGPAGIAHHRGSGSYAIFSSALVASRRPK